MKIALFYFFNFLVCKSTSNIKNKVKEKPPRIGSPWEETTNNCGCHFLHDVFTQTGTHIHTCALSSVTPALSSWMITTLTWSFLFLCVSSEFSLLIFWLIFFFFKCVHKWLVCGLLFSYWSFLISTWKLLRQEIVFLLWLGTVLTTTAAPSHVWPLSTRSIACDCWVWDTHELLKTCHKTRGYKIPQ